MNGRVLGCNVAVADRATSKSAGYRASLIGFSHGWTTSDAAGSTRRPDLSDGRAICSPINGHHHMIMERTWPRRPGIVVLKFLRVLVASSDSEEPACEG
jgi:hypothetical protein